MARRPGGRFEAGRPALGSLKLVCEPLPLLRRRNFVVRRLPGIDVGRGL